MKAARREPGRVITFYSYKGGTGRSMALSNVAWVLAAAGKSVLLIDWDLEAPGLHRYFKPFLTDHELGASDGLMDLIDAYTSEAIKPLPEGGELDRDWWRPLTDLSDYLLPIEFEHFPSGGRIDLLGAGRQSPNYAVKVNSFNWQNFYDRLGGGGFLDAMKNAAAQEYDYILIDSRTGVSDTAGICTAQMPDTLVVCFTYNNQSIKGAQAVTASAMAQRVELAQSRHRSLDEAPGDQLSYSPRPYRVFPVPMRADTSESDRLSLRQAFAREAFDIILHASKVEDKAQYWARVEVPYWPIYAYEEVLSPLRDDPHSTRSVLYSFTQIASYLTDGEVDGYRLALDPALQQQYLEAFAETPQSTSARHAALEAARETEEQLLVRRAEEAIQKMAETQRQVARSVLCRLLRIAKEEGGRHYPVRVPSDDFNERQHAMVAMLAERAVIAITVRTNTMTGSPEQVIGFADERLPAIWTRLKEWLESDLPFLLWRQQLRDYRSDWARTGEKSVLLGETLLSEALQWERQRPDDLNTAEREFIRASEAASAEVARLRWQRRAVRALSLTGLMALVVLGTLLFIRETPTALPTKGMSSMPVLVPVFTGASPEEAQKIAQALNLKVMTLASSNGAEQVFTEGIVTRQEPDPRTLVQAGATVRLFIAANMNTVPLVVGLDQAAATALLQQSGLKIEVGPPVIRTSAEAKPGAIVEQMPDPGTLVAAGRPVVVSFAEPPPALNDNAELARYKIAIFFYEDEADGEDLAQRIADRLKASGLKRIELRPSSESFMQQVYPPKTVEVRFESGREEAPADALLALVQQVEGVGKPRRFAVATQTPEYLSVFIPKLNSAVVLCKTEYSRDCGGNGVWIGCGGDVGIKGAEVCGVKSPLTDGQWRVISSVSRTRCGLSFYRVTCP